VASVTQAVRELDPVSYLRVVASLVPKEVNVDTKLPVVVLDFRGFEATTTDPIEGECQGD